MPALCDIDHGANHLNKFSIATQNRVADAMNLFDCAIGCHGSELDVAMYFLEERPISCHPELVPVFWVYSLYPLVPQGQALLWIKAEKSEHFLGPVQDLAACAINRTAARVGQPLRFCQISFAALESLLCSF